MKIILAILIAFLVAFSLCACETGPVPSQYTDGDISIYIVQPPAISTGRDSTSTKSFNR